jgi:TPR repeat protein
MRFLPTIGIVLALVVIPAIADDFEDGSIALERSDYATAFTKFKASAEQGNIEAQYKLGGMFADGEGVGRDFKQAAFWTTKAATQGHAGAQFNLGNMYSQGRGVPQDYKQAASWYEKAAAQGYASAQLNLGLIYFRGDGVARDYKQAVAWLEKAAAQGHAGAQNQLGNMYSQGQGVAVNYVEAHKWWSLAIAGNQTTASFFLAARKNRETVERLMTREQIAEAQRRAGEWVVKVRAPLNWVLTGGGDSEGGYAFFADPATISRIGDVVKMWSMYDYKVAQGSKLTGNAYLSLRARNEYDCKDRKERRLYFSLHARQMARGGIVSTTAGSASPDHWDPVSPGSTAEYLWKIACGKQ